MATNNLNSGKYYLTLFRYEPYVSPWRIRICRCRGLLYYFINKSDSEEVEEKHASELIDTSALIEVINEKN